MTLALILFAFAAPAGGPPMHFQHTPLGNVVRALSARFRVPIGVKGGAKAPITADLTGLPLIEALQVAATQAGLEVQPLGSRPEQGYVLRPHPEPDPAVIKAEAARRRAELLKERERLEHEEAAQAGRLTAD